MTHSPELGRFLKTQQVAKALGVSVSTIKRWVDSGMLPATRTVGKHRLIAREAAEQFAREQGLRCDSPRVGTPAAVRLDDSLVDQLVVALRRGRSQDARELILRSYASLGAVSLADDVIRPVMQRIGHDWETSSIDVYQEHRATRLVTHALMELLQEQRFRYLDGHGPLAIGAAPENDPYVLPGLLCELILREQGWEVMNLGVNLPLASLARAVQAHRPQLTWLSVSHVADQASFLHEYSQFYASASLTGTAVVVGGQALTAESRARIVAASLGDRMSHLAEFARRLRPGAAAPASRPEPDRPT